MTRLTRSADSYVETASPASISSRPAIDRLAAEFRRHEEDLRDHGYSVVVQGSQVAVKRGHLDIVRVDFDNGDSPPRRRVVNGVREALNQAPAYVDVDSDEAAVTVALKMLPVATDEFYGGRSLLERVGIV